MGAGQSAGVIEAARYERPQQFVTQANTDWKTQVERVYRGTRPTVCKTVILPPGCQLNDPRLKEGVVVSERKYTMPSGVVPSWPSSEVFEVDVDGQLLPPCWGREGLPAHFIVYPDKHFPDINCGYCELHRNSEAVKAEKEQAEVTRITPVAGAAGDANAAPLFTKSDHRRRSATSEFGSSAAGQQSVQVGAL